jgi:hypothetical protein
MNIGKKLISILPFRRNRAPKFHDSLLPLARKIHRAVFIKTNIGAELHKDDVYDFMEKRAGLDVYFNCKTGYIQDIIIKQLYREIPNDIMCSVGAKDSSCTFGALKIYWSKSRTGGE